MIDSFVRIADNSPADYTSLKLSSFEYLSLPKLSFEFDTEHVFSSTDTSA